MKTKKNKTVQFGAKNNRENDKNKGEESKVGITKQWEEVTGWQGCLTLEGRSGEGRLDMKFVPEEIIKRFKYITESSYWIKKQI